MCDKIMKSVSDRRKQYQEGLITKAEYLLEIINVCSAELYKETQILYGEHWKLQKIIKEANKDV